METLIHGSKREMITKEDKVRIVITCDGCGVVRQDQEGQHARWRPNAAVWKEAQSAGWTSRQKADKSAWDHFCPGCQSTG